MPATEPMTKASTDSTSVIHRCFQIVPSTNHLTMRAATSYGVEKKNGGRSCTPAIGTVVKTCQSSTTATATSDWSRRSLARDTNRTPRELGSLFEYQAADAPLARGTTPHASLY